MRADELVASRYRLERRIGLGGMGEVWRAFDVRLDRPVAVKLLRRDLSDNATFRTRFATEARLVAALSSPAVATVHDYGEDGTGDGPRCYLVMELLDGRSLAELLTERERLTPAETTRVIVEAAQGLHAAHRSGIVHRDVKPANIVVTADWGVKIIDFGIARAAGEAGLTAPGAMVGTAAYASPEHLRQEDPSPAADVYSLGAVAYECLTGAPPFPGDSTAAVIAGHLHRSPPPLPGDLPEGLAAAVLTALRKDPADRFGGAQEFAEACLRGMDSPPGSPAVPTVVGGAGADAEGTASGDADVDAAFPPTAVDPDRADEGDGEAVTVVATDAVNETGDDADGGPLAPTVVDTGGRAPAPPAPTKTPTIEHTVPVSESRRRRPVLLPVLAGSAVLAIVIAILFAGPLRPGTGEPGNEAGARHTGAPATSSPSPAPVPVNGGPSASGSPAPGEPDTDSRPGDGDDPGPGGGDDPGPGGGDDPGPGGGDDGGGNDGGGGDDGGDTGGGDEENTQPPGKAVPDLTGMGVYAVDQYLADHGFPNDKGVCTNESHTYGVVYDQSPAPGTIVDPSTVIRWYWYGNGVCQ